MNWTIETAAPAVCDVLVAGAGTAGVFAAISAARRGARVLLVEKGSMPGGTMTAAGVNFPGLFYAWGKQIIAGPCWEAIRRADALGGAEIPEQIRLPKRHWHLQIRLDVFTWTAVLEEMLAEAGVEVLYHTMIAALREDADGVDALLTEKEGARSVRAKILIDATGDANAAAALGYAVEKSEILQPATLMNTITGYRLEDVSEADVREVFARAAADGEVFPRDFQGTSPMAALRMGKFHMHIPVSAPETSAGKSELERAARALCLRLTRIYRRVPGLESLRVASFSPECGVRESVRIVGETRVTAEDYLAGRVWDDSVCYAFYPIDRHTDTGIHQVYHAEDVVATVPYRALIPAGARRVLAAGRCISADTDANSALRVEAPCMATGQAAGAAAALAVGTGDVSAVSVEALKDSLRALGAIVP